ncbi:MAG: hypothetical protein HY261_02345 [Chloroflexi bacterium]|nr:hypothetical protein [Chloroflexota bacterium]
MKVELNPYTVQGNLGGIAFPSDMSVAVYAIKNDQRPAGGVQPLDLLSAGKLSTNITVPAGGAVVYVLAVNAGQGVVTLSVKVSESIPPTPAPSSGSASALMNLDVAAYADSNAPVIHANATLTVQATGGGVSVSKPEPEALLPPGAIIIKYNKNAKNLPLHIDLAGQGTLDKKTVTRTVVLPRLPGADPDVVNTATCVYTYTIAFDFNSIKGVVPTTKTDQRATLDFTPDKFPVSAGGDVYVSLLESHTCSNGSRGSNTDRHELIAVIYIETAN